MAEDAVLYSAVRRLAEALAEDANRDRYVGGPHTSPMVEPPEYDADDLEDEARRLIERGAWALHRSGGHADHDGGLCMRCPIEAEIVLRAALSGTDRRA